jgi:hypothetical protein
MKPVCIAAFVLTAVSTSMPARAQATLFSDSFDQDLGQWVATGLWHFQNESGACSSGVVPFPSAGGSAAFNSLGNSNCGFFTSAVGDLTLAQPISIPAGAANARLRFMSFEETECGGANCGWDERFVSVSSDGGAHWTDIAWGATEGAWNERILSLDAYRGSDVLLRFRFDPVDTLWNNFRGWLIDEVEVEIDSPFTFYCTGKVSSVHCIPTIDAAGDVSLSGPDDLVVSAGQLRNNVMSKLIWSRSPNNLPFHGGTLCVAAAGRAHPGHELRRLDFTGELHRELQLRLHARLPREQERAGGRDALRAGLDSRSGLRRALEPQSVGRALVHRAALTSTRVL